MDTPEQYAKWAQDCVNSAADAQAQDREEEARRETYWQREAQVFATLALASAVVEVRNVLIARLPS